MPTTRAGATTARTQAQLDEESVLNHILQTIMGFPTDSDAWQALNAAGVMSVKDLLLLDGEMFTQLSFMAGTDEKKLKFLDVAKLRKFFPFHLALCERDIIFRVSDNDWYNISDNDWDAYCVSPAAFLVGRAPTPTTLVSTTPPTHLPLPYVITLPSRSRRTQRLILLSRKPSSGIHGIESFTARRICTI